MRKAKADALVRREMQLREVELVELRARLVRRRKGAVEDGASVDQHSLRRWRNGRLEEGSGRSAS